MPVTGYHMFETLQDDHLYRGKTVHAFRTLRDLQEYLRWTGAERGTRYKYYEVTGDLKDDDGGPDGLLILVRSYREIHPIA